MLELTPSPPTDAASSQPEGAVKLLENDRLIAWDLTWMPGQSVRRLDKQFDSVTVFLESGTIHHVADRGAARDTARTSLKVLPLRGLEKGTLTPMGRWVFS